MKNDIKTTQKLSAQARKSVNRINQIQKPFGKFNNYELFKMFDTMVMPILTYRSEIWGYEYTKCIEQI